MGSSTNFKVLAAALLWMTFLLFRRALTSSGKAAVPASASFSE